MRRILAAALLAFIALPAAALPSGPLFPDLWFPTVDAPEPVTRDARDAAGL